MQIQFFREPNGSSTYMDGYKGFQTTFNTMKDFPQNLPNSPVIYHICFIKTSWNYLKLWIKGFKLEKCGKSGLLGSESVNSSTRECLQYTILCGCLCSPQYFKCNHGPKAEATSALQAFIFEDLSIDMNNVDGINVAKQNHYSHTGNLLFCVLCKTFVML